jgi:hypothetical protein
MAKAKSHYPKILKINFNVLILTRAVSHFGQVAIYMKKYL